MKFLIYVLVFLCAYGTTYYVSINGNDNWSGTSPDSAWRHINRACTTVVAGDTVLVLPGDYNERVTFRRSGNAHQKIVFKSHPRRTATTWGFDTNSPTAGSYTRIEGFNIEWDTSLTSWRDFGIFINSNNVEIVDNYISNFRKTAIQGNWSQPWRRDIYIANNRIFHCQMGIGVQGTKWIIENNEIEKLFYYRPGDCDYTRFFGDSILFKNNYFHGTHFDSIGTAHVDCFQTFDNNGEHARYVVIDGNRGFDFHQGFMGEANYYHNSHDIIFKNNIFARGGAWGLCVKNIANVKAYNNTFAYIRWHGVGFSGQYAQNGDVRNNIFFNTNTSYWWADTATATGDYNLIFGARPPTVVGPHDILNQDPLFVDSVNNDFRLRPNSPAIDHGDSLLEVIYDIIGVPRPQGPRWDIGAYEYSAGGITEIKKECKIKSSEAIVPNPFSHFAILKGSTKQTCTVYDVSGRKIKTYSVKNIGSDLNPGVYFVSDGEQILRAVKIK
ncbi:MAG: T9SS type A sorting domain-containing protein [candidate division WOR-3 bacterium]|nr:T9SS type A sorting domain-containing protein [candidate division WOR-3 bacterium]